MPRRLISAPGTTTDRWVYLLMYDVAVREVVVMATCFSKNAKGPQRPGDPPPSGPTRLAYSCWTVPARDLLSRACRKERSGPPRVLETPVSADNGSLCHGNGGHEWGARAGGR